MAKTSAPPRKPVKAAAARPPHVAQKAKVVPARPAPPAKPAPVAKKLPARAPAPVADRKPMVVSEPIAPVHVHPSLEISALVDPLLAGGQPPMKLVGGHDRDAQLPTTLVPKLELPAAVPLTIHAQAVPGAAHHGNSQPANILVLVSCGGWPVVDLCEDHFSVMEHFEVPGQVAPFSNNVVSFRNNGSGAYLIQVRPIGGAPWAGGQHLAQILVSSPDERHGQTSAKLIIR